PTKPASPPDTCASKPRKEGRRRDPVRRRIPPLTFDCGCGSMLDASAQRRCAEEATADKLPATLPRSRRCVSEKSRKSSRSSPPKKRSSQRCSPRGTGSTRRTRPRELPRSRVPGAGGGAWRGYRVWRIVGDGLTGWWYTDYLWAPGVSEASCSPRRWTRRGRRARHPDLAAPKRDCACGLYALQEPWDFAGYLPSRHFGVSSPANGVMGGGVGWGRVFRGK